MQLVIALTILALTITLAVSRIKIKKFTINPAIASLIGAVLMAVFKIVPKDVWQTSLDSLCGPMITILSLMMITFVADHSGLFNTMIQFLIERAKGDGKKLFGILFFCGSFLGMWMSHEAVILFFTPIFLSLVERVSRSNWKTENKIPYYFAVLSMANIVGGFTISNPINIVVANRFNIGFREYASWMAIPAIFAVVVTFCALFFFFSDKVSDTYKVPPKNPVTDEKKVFQIWVGLSFGITCLFLLLSRESFSQFILPISAIVSFLLFRIFSEENSQFILREMGWDLIIFIYGIFIIAIGLKNAGLAVVFKEIFLRFYHNHFTVLSFVVGAVSAVGSALVNDHATVNFLTWVVKDLNMDIHEIKVLAYSIIIGGNIGPKMFPLGSLAAMMWLRMLRKKGVKISLFKYVKVGIPVAVSVLIFALITLNIEYGLMFL